MKWAKLDDSGLLLTIEDAQDEAWPHWAGPFDEIDNAPGRYVWDGAKFEPIGAGTLKASGPAPSPEGALYAFLKSEQRQGRVIPPKTLKWLEFYRKSLDAQGREG